MQRIRTLTLSASPKGVTPAGTILELPDDEAKARVDGGYAEYVRIDSADRVKPIETATAEPPPERTETRGRRQRRKMGAPS
jgi:hypothetical protein